jgi:ABC-type antimicrobial peptide transport system permease subunit
VTRLVVPSNRDPQQLAAAMKTTLQDLDAGLPFTIGPWTMDAALFAPHVATVSLGVMGVMGAMLAVTGIFGMAAYSVSKRLRELGIRIALGAQRRGVLEAALARPLKLLALGSAAGLLLGILATRVLAFIVYQATPRDPLVLGGVVLAMVLLGLWPHGFRRNARWRSILRSCCAKSDAAATYWDDAANAESVSADSNPAELRSR